MQADLAGGQVRAAPPKHDIISSVGGTDEASMPRSSDRLDGEVANFRVVISFAPLCRRGLCIKHPRLGCDELRVRLVVDKGESAEKDHTKREHAMDEWRRYSSRLQASKLRGQARVFRFR